jgi:hypothetical protein
MTGEAFYPIDARNVLRAAIGYQKSSGDCDDCDADTALYEAEPGIFVIQIRHDDTCPWLARHERKS